MTDTIVVDVLISLLILAVGILVGFHYGVRSEEKFSQQWRQIAYDYRRLYDELVAAARGEK